MEGLEYLIALKEQISGPAAKAADQIKTLASKMTAAKDAMSKLDAASEDHAKALKQQQKVQAAAGKAFTENNEAMMAGMTEVASAAAAGAVAVLGFVAAIGAVTYAGMSLAIEASEFKGDTMDALELLTGSADKAQETFGYLDALSSRLPLPRKRVFELGQELALAGIDQQARLEASIENIANLGQVPGGGGEKLKGIIEKSQASGKFEVKAKSLSGTGASLDALAEVLGKKLGKSNETIKAQLKAGTIDAGTGIDALNEVIKGRVGGIAAKQMMDIGVMVQKLKDTWMKMWEALAPAVEPFMKALSELFGIFNEDQAAGAAIKDVLVGTFTSVFKAATAAIPYITLGIKKLIILFLQAAIVIQPLIRQFIRWFMANDGLGKMWVIMKGIAATLLVITALAAVVFAPLIAVSGIVWAGLMAIFYAIGSLADSLMDLGPNAYDAAAAFIEGLVNGIKNGIGKVKDAVTGVAGTAKDAVTDFFGISSPSKVMQELGMFTMAGFSKGIEGGAAGVTGSFSEAVSPLAGGAAGGGSAGGGGGITAGGVTININGVAGAESIAGLLPGAIADAFEQIAQQMGGSLSPGGA